MQRSPEPLFINLAEPFEHLPKAPISEAVLEIKGRTTTPWEESIILSALKARLTDYPNVDSRRAQKITFDGKTVPSSSVVDLGWTGVVARSEDGCQVANFQKDSFSFSRLAPYQGWTEFSTEAFRLYELYLTLARPADAQRIGLRFINQFDVPATGFELSDYFTQPPSAHAGLPLEPAVFFHRDTFRTPGHPYSVTVIRTLQPSFNQVGLQSSPKLILDIDVFTERPLLIDVPQMIIRIQEMRWIKNKVFFGSLTPSAKNSFQ